MMSKTGRPRRWVLGAVATVAAAMLSAGVLGISVSTAPQSTATVPDMRGNRVALDPGTVPKPAVVKKMAAVEDTGVRFEVPAVRLNVPLGALNAVDGVIVPPGFTSAYLVRNFGVPPSAGSSGTVYVVMHSIRGGGTGPGNYLYDTATGKSNVPIGSTIEAGGFSYNVTAVQTADKPALRDDAAIWANTPRRLVVITCLELPSGAPSQDNFIITATQNSP